jgi:hypothetical protein
MAHRIALAIAAVILVIAAAAPAHAQTYQFVGRA